MKGWEGPGICTKVWCCYPNPGKLPFGLFQQRFKSYALCQLAWIFSCMPLNLMPTVSCLSFSQGHCHFQVITQFFPLHQSEVQSHNSCSPCIFCEVKLWAAFVKHLKQEVQVLMGFMFSDMQIVIGRTALSPSSPRSLSFIACLRGSSFTSSTCSGIQ